MNINPMAYNFSNRQHALSDFGTTGLLAYSVARNLVSLSLAGKDDRPLKMQIARKISLIAIMTTMVAAQLCSI